MNLSSRTITESTAQTTFRYVSNGNFQINNNIKLNFIVDLIIIAVVVYLRQKELGNTLDIIYIPFFIIAALDLLEKIPCIKKILYNFGKQSTNSPA